MKVRKSLLIFFVLLTLQALAESAGDVPEQLKDDPPRVRKDAVEKISKWPIFKEVVWDNVFQHEIFFEGPEPTDFVISMWVKKPVTIGGVSYPRGTFVSGIGQLIRMGGDKMKVTVNSIKICGNLGQHAQTLEIFEIRLCEDLKLPEGIIPAGSIIDFPKELPKSGINFSNIRCLKLSKPTTLKGRSVPSGIGITPNYEVWEKPDRDCMRSAD